MAFKANNFAAEAITSSLVMAPDYQPANCPTTQIPPTSAQGKSPASPKKPGF
jgi:hypothetical protein